MAKEISRNKIWEIFHEAKEAGDIVYAFHSHQELFREILKEEREELAPFEASFLIKGLSKKENATEFSLKLDTGKVQNLLSGSLELDFYLPNHSLFFRSKIVNGKRDFSFSFPHLFFKCDRRYFSRYRSMSSIQIILPHERNPPRRKCFDLGLGGMSIIFSKTDLHRLRKGQRLSEVKIIAENAGTPGVELLLDCEVIEILKLEPFKYENCPYGGARVSFRFERLDKTSENKLAKILKRNIMAKN